ncbi:hypothetical protein [Lacipirellula sp.]|uniref:hypothetical protein n=1 Tax=Lacipirellula sp. TaxID=2691419 RepID=UPI003D0FB26F
MNNQRNLFCCVPLFDGLLSKELAERRFNPDEVGKKFSVQWSHRGFLRIAAHHSSLW